jgi:hypothetical protein
MARFPFAQRVVLAVLLAVVLTVPAALGAQPRPHAEGQQTAFVTALVWELRTQVWSLLSGFWEKNGCIGDPNGGCVSGSSTTDTTVHGDAGCVGDPNGGCNPGH